VFPKARAAALRAIELDSMNAEGWAALAHYNTYFGWDWNMAEYAFNRANELNPNLAYNHYHRAWYLALFGRMNEAIEEHKLAQELDPFTPLHTAWLGELYRMVGLYEEGLAEVEKVEHMQDDYALGYLIKGRLLMDQGRTVEGLEALKKASDINPGWKYFGYGRALIKSGKTNEGKAIIDELENMPITPYNALCLGLMYVDLDDFTKAIEWFSYKEKHGWYPWIRVLSENKAFLRDPRLLELIREMNLPDPSPLVFEAQ
jgi:tetratricopeptide (TPR) repeat protein